MADATGKEVVALAVDVGQGGEDMEDIRQRALDCGAVESVVVDAKEEFGTDYLMPALKANALYQKTYPLVSALSRPLIARHLASVAKELGANSVGQRAAIRSVLPQREGHADANIGEQEHADAGRYSDGLIGSAGRRLRRPSHHAATALE